MAMARGSRGEGQRRRLGGPGEADDRDVVVRLLGGTPQVPAPLLPGAQAGQPAGEVVERTLAEPRAVTGEHQLAHATEGERAQRRLREAAQRCGGPRVRAPEEALLGVMATVAVHARVAVLPAQPRGVGGARERRPGAEGLPACGGPRPRLAISRADEVDAAVGEDVRDRYARLGLVAGAGD